MEHVFVSYVREDAAQVDRLATDLRSAGISVWLDREQIQPGQLWKEAIRGAIKQGAFFLVCFSPNYVDRARTYANEEFAIALEELRQRPFGKPWFIPILLSRCDVPDQPITATTRLSDIQWIDLDEDWTNGLARLISLIIRLRAPTLPRARLEGNTRGGRRAESSGRAIDGAVVPGARPQPASKEPEVVTGVPSPNPDSRPDEEIHRPPIVPRDIRFPGKTTPTRPAASDEDADRAPGVKTPLSPAVPEPPSAPPDPRLKLALAALLIVALAIGGWFAFSRMGSDSPSHPETLAAGLKPAGETKPEGSRKEVRQNTKPAEQIPTEVAAAPFPIAYERVRTIVTGNDSQHWAGQALSPSGEFVSGTENGRLRIWNVSTGRIALDKVVSRTWCKAFSRDDKYIVCNGDSTGAIGLFNCKTGALVAELPKITGSADFVFSPDGRFLAGAAWNQQFIRIYDLSTYRTALEISTRKKYTFTSSVAFSPDGKTVAVADRDYMRLWSLETKLASNSLAVKDASGLFYGGDGGALGWTTEGGQIEVWNVAKKAPVLEKKMPKETSLLYLDLNAQKAIVLSKSSVKLWNLGTDTLETLIPKCEYPRVSSGLETIGCAGDRIMWIWKRTNS